jgi:tetratricopeptide (TPR) repeat protein
MGFVRTKRNFRKLLTGVSLATVLCLGAGPVRGQSPAEKVLLEKAQSLEQSGHIDLAAQTWQQVLLSDPNNQEALAGLGRWAKLSGNDAEAETYIERLRAVNPNSPEIAKIEALVSNKTQNQLLEQAAELAKNGHNEEALRIYRQTFGEHPPDNWALAYYDTEAGIPATRQDAIDGLRGLTAKYPSDPQYAIDLGRVLTYDPRTRGEGEKILSQYPQDPVAQTVLRAALVWDVQNPASVAAVREYLKQHPDPELAKDLAETEATQAKATAGIARTAAEQAAFRELAANHLAAAQQLLMDLNEKQPTNPRVLAGLGFVRMKQSNFSEAAKYFEQAEQNGLRSPLIGQSLATSRFWNTMQQGTEALNANRLDEAVKEYKAALGLRPGSLDALTGEAGAYMKMQEPEQAVPLYQQLLRKQPRSAAVWRGLFMAEAEAGQGKAAIATARQFPASLRASVARDADYLRTLARAYVAIGQDAEAQRILLQAMNLHFPASQELIKTEVTLQYAALLAKDKNFTQAAAIYRRVLREDPNNVSAWQGMVSLEHLAGRDPDAIAVVERMPPEAYDNALRDGGFLSMLAAIYQGQNHPDVAEGFLERAIRIYQENGQALPIPLQLQVAAVDLERNHPQAAYSIYRSVLTEHPDRLDAWKGLLAALHATDHDTDALAQIQQIPPAVRKALATDVEYQQTLAAIYAANGDQRGALALLTEVEDYYRAEGRMAPVDVDIANAWTLFNVGDDRDLYRQLMGLGDRQDMSDEERRQVQTIWASWAQRRAAQAAAAGNPRRGVEILMAAAQAFPGNPAVSKALAVGFVQAGQPKDAMAIYQALDMTNASATDYQSMVGAAVAVQNMKQAEAWLREALAKYPNDPKVLATAAQFEQARGDRARAADYWRASLNAMPAVSPSTNLAHKLDQADLVKQTKPAKPTDLVNLLNPDGDLGMASEGSGVPLPSYSNPNSTRASNEPLGPDPYYVGTAPVQINNNAGAQSAEGASDLQGLPLPGPAPANAGSGTGASAPTSGNPAPAGSGVTTQPMATPSNSNPATKPAKPAQAPVKPYVPQASVPTSNGETQASIPEEQPHELGLETSPALTPLPNATDEATQQAQTALDAAKKPIDPSMVSTQYSPPGQEPSLQPNAQPNQEQPPDYFERPPTLNPSGNGSGQPGATDDELMRENLPPLHGPYQRPSIVRQQDLREQAQIHLGYIMGGYSPWLGGTGIVNHRSGTAGFDALTVLQAPFEASAPLGTGARLTIISNPVFLDAGGATTSPLLPGGVVEQLGTAPANSVLNQQNATGVGGEVQLATENFAVSAGYSPWGFLVANVIGRLNWKPANGPFTFTANRDSVKDSQLSYSGLHDPGSAGPGYEGNIWGGVVATGGDVQFGKSDPNSGFYISGGGQYINGVHVQTNDRIDGDAGAYWQVKEVPDQGNLSMGVNFFGMHYAHNSNFFTYGQGGYFSPQAYFLANVPFSFQGRYGANVHYSVVAAFGVEAFQQDSVPFFPLDSALQVANNNPSYSAETVVSGNYDFHGEVAYHLSDHWFAGGFLSLNNTRNYNNQVVGFFVRWTSRPQVESELGPTGLYPWEGLRPYLAP